MSRDPTIWEDMMIQDAIEEALKNVCNKFGIYVDYTWDYKE